MKEVRDHARTMLEVRHRKPRMDKFISRATGPSSSSSSHRPRPRPSLNSLSIKERVIHRLLLSRGDSAQDILRKRKRISTRI